MTGLFGVTDWQAYFEEGNLAHIPTSSCVTLAFDTSKEIKNIPRVPKYDSNTIFNTMKRLAPLKTLVNEIKYLGMEDYFQSQQLTFFAPNYSSLEMYSMDNEETKNFERVRRSRMLDILNAHVLEVPLYPEQMSERILRIHTLLKDYFIISDNKNNKNAIYNTSSKNDPAKIISTINCSNGMLYILDKLIYPDVLVIN